MKLSLTDLQTIRSALEYYEKSAGHNYLLIDKSSGYKEEFKALKKHIINTLNARLLTED